MNNQSLSSFNSKVCKVFIFSKYLQKCGDVDDMSIPIHSQCYRCVQNIRHQHVDMLWAVHATCQCMRRWRVIQCRAKRLTDAAAILSFFLQFTSECRSEKLLKSVHVRQSYHKKTVKVFFSVVKVEMQRWANCNFRF